MLDIRFSNDHSSRQIGDVATVLSSPRLWVPTSADYPRHSEWLDKTEAGIASNERRALLAYIGQTPVGAIVYRREQALHNVVAIRNISINPMVSGRLFGSFMLRQVEIEAAEHDYIGTDTITVDTKAKNAQMVSFLESQGYGITDVADLYHDGTGEDVILTKSLES